MARRTSARLRNQSATTPKRVSLSHDAPTRTPRTLPAKLSAVEEKDDEMPGAFPAASSPTTATVAYPMLPTNTTSSEACQTPVKKTEMKPDDREMHPERHHQSTAKFRDEARHLGFSNMVPHTEPAKPKGSLATLQGTPTKTRDLEKDAKSPSYQFTFNRDFSLELSPEAKQLMAEKRDEAARIRQQMMADGEAPQSIDQVLAARKMAKPKGRFSQAHMKEEDKMDSIVNHASAWRADPSRFKPVVEVKPAGPTSLKRSPAKAKLDEPDTPTRPPSSNGATQTSVSKGSALPRTTSFRDLRAAAAQISSAKRVKRVETDDVSATRAPSELVGGTPSGTPNRQWKLDSLSTPTQASLARTASLKTNKITSRIPAPQATAPQSPLKSAMKKPALVSEPQASPHLLARSPSKASLSAPKPTALVNEDVPASMMSASLARSPAKSGLAKKHTTADSTEPHTKEKPVPFLSRSPTKASGPKTTEENPFQTASAAVPLLSRSPAKLPAVDSANVDESSDKSATSKLMGRFNLLRQSPMKSILRSPQRLYSDDPSKVAAGTHLATPPGKNAAMLNKALPSVPQSTDRARKHVDFSSSTKARDAKTQSAASGSDSKTPTPSPKPQRTIDVRASPEQVVEAPSEQETSAYPSLPLAVPSYDRVPSLSPSPQKRRQTAGPQDFTFRAGEQDVVFAQSPNAPASATRRVRPATIRYVSADAIAPVASPFGTKKRKFEFENQQATAEIDKIVSPPVGTKKRKFEFENKIVQSKPEDDVEMFSDKENTTIVEHSKDTDTERPAKRMKPSGPSPKAKLLTTAVPKAATQMNAAAVARRTTLGVKAKGAKNTSPVKKPRPSSTISQARLVALSQPKKRN